MIKTQIGLGVLSFPSVFDTLGIVPGVILLLVVGGITTWSDYMVGVFKVNHPEVYGVDDVGQIIFGKIGKEVLAFAFMGRMFASSYDPLVEVLTWFQLTPGTEYIMTAGSAMLSLSISLNALSDHAACTAIYVAVAAIAVFGLSSIRTLGRITWLAWCGAICVIVAGKRVHTKGMIAEILGA